MRKKVLKKFILMILLFVIYVAVAYLLYTYNKERLEGLLMFLGSFYIGKSMCKFVDWFIDTDEQNKT